MNADAVMQIFSKLLIDLNVSDLGSLPIQWPNRDFNFPDESAPYLEVSYKWGLVSSQISVNRQRNTGNFEIVIYHPAGEGVGWAVDLCDTLVENFSDLRFEDNTFRTLIGSQMAMGVEGQYHMIKFSLPFEYERDLKQRKLTVSFT